ncbi:hypothetical protein SASPL_118459 [Salvia splendens]|uniref:BED-type domain-containing protein n=1 Tax=Salvia splendens TaxID=180675 RepID=A0A8X8XXS6_SALSN|nr:hypothetical protein SASPL_118459 [Salvia splendens]
MYADKVAYVCRMQMRMESEDSHTLSDPSLPISESPNTSTNDDGSSRKRPIEVEGAADKPPLPPTKRSRSPYWEHCKKETKDTSSGKIQIGVCNYCKTEIPAIRGSTSGLKNHLVNMCKLSPLFDVSSEKGQTVLTKDTMQQGSRIVPHSFSQKMCELKMTQYVIKDEVCFRAVEKPGFVALVNELEPRFQMPNQKKVAKYKGVNDTVLNQRPLLECEDVGDSSNKEKLNKLKRVLMMIDVISARSPSALPCSSPCRLIQKDVSNTTIDAMKRTISGMLGLLPSEQFQVMIDALWESLSKLLISSMMTRYTLRNAEYRLSLERNLEIYEGNTYNLKNEDLQHEAEEALNEEGKCGKNTQERLSPSDAFEEWTCNIPGFGEMTPESFLVKSLPSHETLVSRTTLISPNTAILPPVPVLLPCHNMLHHCALQKKP